MKINEVVNEAGFWSGVKQAVTPKSLKSVSKTNTKSLSKADANAMAQKLYGPDEDDWLSAEEIARKNQAAAQAASNSAAPQSPIQHPDLSVISSYPVRLRYKNGDYVLDPNTNQWMTVTGKKVAPQLASFLQHHANKL